MALLQAYISFKRQSLSKASHFTPNCRLAILQWKLHMSSKYNAHNWYILTKMTWYIHELIWTEKNTLCTNKHTTLLNYIYDSWTYRISLYDLLIPQTSESPHPGASFGNVMCRDQTGDPPIGGAFFGSQGWAKEPQNSQQSQGRKPCKYMGVSENSGFSPQIIH